MTMLVASARVSLHLLRVCLPHPREEGYQRRRKKVVATDLTGGDPLCFYLYAGEAGCGGVMPVDVDPM